MSATIHQCAPPVWVNTPLGDGNCLFLIDYGVSTNSVWVVHLSGTGKVVHFDSSDIRAFGNPMYGTELDPVRWRKEQTATANDKKEGT